MSKLQKLPLNQWIELRNTLTDQAHEELAEWLGRDKAHVDVHYVASRDYAPCIYRGKTIFYGIKIPKKRKPKNFKFTPKQGVLELLHINSSGCPYLNMRKTVHCFARVEDEKKNPSFYYTTHRVGNCPWKE